MVSDKEILILSIELYVCNTADSLFGISSLPAQTLLKYGVRNVFDKYGTIIDLFIDLSGKINQTLLFDAFKSEVRNRGGIKLLGLKFTENDFEEISNIYNKLILNNV